MKPMYKAELCDFELVITEVSPEIYKRISTQGLGNDKVHAIEILKGNVMDDFLHKIKAIDWQSIKYVKGI